MVTVSAKQESAVNEQRDSSIDLQPDGKGSRREPSTMKARP